MNVWDMLQSLYSSFVETLQPVFMAEFGGFTYLQYSFFAFLICCVVRFVFPLLSGGGIGSVGIVFSRADEVKDKNQKAL